MAVATLEKRYGCYVLADLAVKDELRGTGLGKKLLQIAEEEAKELGAKEMWLVGKTLNFTESMAGRKWIVIRHRTYQNVRAVIALEKHVFQV